MKLGPGFLHQSEASIVIINVGVSTAAVGIVDDSSISHHVDSLVVLGRALSVGKHGVRNVLESFSVGEHLNKIK